MNYMQNIDEDSNNILHFKIIIVGQQGVGKSCILNRFTKNDYTDNYNLTVGVEFSTKRICIKDNILVKLQIWDTAGQESFKSIIRAFYRNAAAVFLVYDITNENSFKNLQDWHTEAKSNTGDDAIYVLIGNQADNEAKRQVKYEDGVRYLNENNMHLFYETSAKNNLNINKVFEQASLQIYGNSQKQLLYFFINSHNTQSIDLNEKKKTIHNQKQKKCC